MLGTMQQNQWRAKIIVMAALCLHNLMRIRYPALQNQDMDHIDDKGYKVPGAWCNDAVLQDVADAGRGYMTDREGKRIWGYLMHYYNN